MDSLHVIFDFNFHYLHMFTSDLVKIVCSAFERQVKVFINEDFAD